MFETKKIVIVGAGKLANALAKNIFSELNSFKIVQIYNRTESKARQLANKINSDFTSEISKIKTDADIYIFAVKDDIIKKIAANKVFEDKILFHTSGSTDINVFADFTDNYGVFYPVQSFADNKKINFANIPICIEGSNGYARIQLIYLAEGLSDKVFVLSSKERLILHISCVFANNFTNLLYLQAFNMLEKENINKEIIIPLIEKNIKTLKNKDIILTGPAARKDSKIIDKHLKTLKYSKNLLEIYDFLTKKIIEQK